MFNNLLPTHSIEETNGCVWSALDKCEMECTNMDYADIDAAVSKLLAEVSYKFAVIKLFLITLY